VLRLSKMVLRWLESLRAAGAPEYDGTFPGTLRVAAGS